ncbi:AN1-type zinc finger protein 6 isoform X1 [Alosa pseudoharengus]|uniref:AN1-type zinc finger protein 6 isoform X1 n=1 Tax=Alosa pseudoharengus TaxID=34774 RepID=UPI003F898A59
MAQETNQTQGPMLCATGCGFYGNPRTNGMCSVCYKDFLQRQNNSGRVSPAAVSSGVSSLGESLPTQCTDSSTVDVSSAFIQAALPLETSSIVASQTLLSQAPVTQCENEESAGAKVDLKTEETQTSGSDGSGQTSVDDQDKCADKSKAKKNRCFTCRKKVGLTGFDCRCGNVFCGIHRYSDIHNCTFDYKADAAEKIRKENPVIVGEKIQKI